MKSLLLLLTTSLCLSVQAMPEAKSLFQKQPMSVVSLPGYDSQTVDLAAALEFSNPCIAETDDIFSSQVDAQIYIYASGNDLGIVCTAHFEPTPRWSIIARGLKVGEQITINTNSSIIVESPVPSICIKSICSDGSQRDSYTCACANGFEN